MPAGSKPETPAQAAKWLKENREEMKARRDKAIEDGTWLTSGTPTTPTTPTEQPEED